MKKMNICYNSKHFLNVLLLIIALLGINTKAWAAVPVYNGGTWYSLYKTDEDYKIKDGTILEYSDVYTPTNGQCIFDYKKYTRISLDSKIEVQCDGTTKNSVTATSKNWTNDYTMSGLLTNYSTITLKKTSGNGAQVRNVRVVLAKHILLDNGTTYGTNALTGVTLNATAYGKTSDAFHINLRSFYVDNTTITYKSNNSEFHFGNGATEKSFSVKSNSCAALGGASNSASAATTLGDPDYQELDLYFTPCSNKNGSSSATITIYDGTTQRATITVSAKVIPTYYFKATAVATAGGAEVKASFTEGSYSAASATTNVTASGPDVASLTKTAYFYAPLNNGDYYFQGWYAEADCSGTRLSTDQTLTRTITANSLNSASPSETKYYAQYKQVIRAEFSGEGQSLMVDGTYDGISYIRTSSETASASSSADFWYEIRTNSPSGNTTGSTHPSQIISYNPSTKLVTAHNAGTATLVLHQKNVGLYESVDKEYTFTVYKYNSVFANVADLNVKVDANVSSAYTLTYTKPNAAYVGADNHTAGTPGLNEASGDFYYTLAQSVTTDVTTGSDQPTWAIAYNSVSKTATGKNAGTGTIYLHQKETYKYSGATKSFVVTVSKYTPSFTWNSAGKTYYYQSTIPSIFSTTGPNAYTVVSDNEASAKVVDNTLHIYNVEETANITVTQEENYKWNGKEEEYVVTPVELNNHVEFNITSENINIFKYGTSSNASLDGNGYKLGDGGLDKTVCEYSIQFTGIPEYLSFDKHMDNYLGQLPVGSESVVYESADGTNWIEVWKNTERKADVNGTNILLKPTTRYLKFYYNGSIYCYYKNIHVTELNQFSAAPAMVDFGTKGTNFGTQEENVTFNHANAGRVTTMEIVGNDAEFFSIERSSIPGTGRDLYSTFTIAVRFDNKGEVRGEDPYSAVLHIEDNKGHILNVPLTGIRNGKTAPEFSFNPNHLPYFVGTNIANVASSTNTDYANCPLTFETNDASVAQVIDGTLHIYNKKQPVTITIRQGENEDYAEGTATFTFTPRERPDRSVPMQLVKAIYNEGTVEAGNKCAWEDSENGVRVGNTNVVVDDLIWEHAEKNFTIAFDGQPGRLSFEYKSAGGIWVVTGGDTFGFHMWEVKESSDGSTWKSVWTAEEAQKEWTSVNEIPLSPTTRYIRFSFSGNYWGYFRNINISELVGYKYLRAEADGRYLSRGAKWGTQAIVDDFGMACRISNYTNDNTNFYTRFLFVDNQQYLYEADNHEMYTDDGTAANNYNLWKQNVIDGTILTFQSGNEYPGDSRKGQYITLDGDALALTADAAAATRWKMEDYTEHPAHILEILNREAAEAASHDFATDVKTLEKVRSRVEENDFERTDITIPALTLGEQNGEYRSGVAGTNAIYDNEISGLQPGFYRLEVKAFSRISSADVAWACHTAGAGMESVLAYIYANDVKYPIQSLYHSYQASPLEPTDELRGGYYYSTDLTSAGEAFDDAKRYLNDVYVYVEADPGKTTGTLRYGIKNPSYVPGAWLAFEEITLTRFARKEYIFNGESITGETTDWQMGGNWNRNTQPDYRHVVSVQHDLVIDEEVSVYSLVIENDKSGNPVTVTIAPTGGLTVGAGGVKNATKDNFILQAGTTGTTKGQTGYLRISPYTREPMPEATVQLFSIGYYDKYAEDTDDDNVAAWQYVGTPIDFKGALAKTAFTRSWIYSYDQTSDSWVNNRKNLVMQPFVGYATTQYDSEEGKLIEYKGTLQPNGGVQTINLAYTDDEHGYNVVANSFAAPIDITKMRKEDFIHVEDPTIYLFHTGTRQQAEENSGTEGNNAGQFISIAIGTAAEMEALFADDDIPTVIAPMQGFGIYASEDGGQIRLDYTKLVWNADYAAHPNKPLRVAQIHEEGADSIDNAEITGALKMTISAEGRSDKCYLIESDRYDSFYEAGYDASKKMSGRLNIFTVADDDKLLAVNATNSIDGTRIGVRTGEEMTYTMTFSHINSEENWMLWDKEAGFKMLLSEDVEYTFNAAPNSEITERFQIIAADIPAIATGVDEVESEVHVQKFIKDNQLYILKDGVLYNASGAVVRK